MAGEEVRGDGQKRLEVGEEHRRAKRNSLIWSGLALLVALGSNSDDSKCPAGSFQAAPIATGMCYPSWVVALVLYVVAAYMLLDYLRADRLLELRHVKALMEAKSQEVIAGFDAVSGRIRETSDQFLRHFQSAHDLIFNIQGQFEGFWVTIKTDFLCFEKHIPNFDEQKYWPNEVLQILHNARMVVTEDDGSAVPSRQLLEEALFQLETHYVNIYSKVSESNSAALELFHQSRHRINALEKLEYSPSSIHQMALEVTNNIDGKLVQIREETNKFRQLHEDLNTVDLLWRKYHDTWPVVAMFGFATIATTWELAFAVYHSELFARTLLHAPIFAGALKSLG